MQPELQTGNTGFGSVAIAPEAQKVLRNTYLLLALTMVPTIAGAWIGMATASVITGSPILSFFVMLGTIIGLQFGIAHFRNSVIGIGLLLLMTGLLGWFIGPLLNHAMALQNGAQLVGYAAAGTGAVFFGMATIATVTKRDFSFMGKFLFVGLVIVVFSLFLLHDLSRIVTGGETNYVMATTGVYISLLNIFTSLLSILTGGRD
jgi:modulator of FtsH protease